MQFVKKEMEPLHALVVTLIILMAILTVHVRQSAYQAQIVPRIKLVLIINVGILVKALVE